MRSMTIVSLLLLSLTLGAQDLPDAATITRQVQDAAKQRKSIEYVREITGEVTLDGKAVTEVNATGRRIPVQSSIGKNASVGPYARLRPGASLGDGARVGNFVEIKAATLEPGVKVNHLSYIGDAHVGSNANIGAGTITCNYDGFGKHKTEIGQGAFIGTNSSLVAPVKIGSRAYIGSGSVITRDVPEDALALERSEQTNREGGAKRYREMKTRGKPPKAG